MVTPHFLCGFSPYLGPEHLYVEGGEGDHGGACEDRSQHELRRNRARQHDGKKIYQTRLPADSIKH